MRPTGELRLGASGVFSGPYTSYYSTTSVAGPSEMSTILECQTNPLSAVTVAIVPWSSTDSNTRVRALSTSFTGFKLGGRENTVAFIAVMSEPMSAFPGTKLVFNEAKQNYGNAYLPRYGAFVCPDDGTYVFMVAVEATYTLSTRWANARLMMNGEQITKGPMTFRTGTTGQVNSGVNSMTSVVQCVKDQDVYVESVKAHTFDYNTFGPYSTFTGFRLNGGDIGFTAVLSSNHTTSASRNLVFDSVITDVGGAFQGSLGQFMCPDNDLYVFTVTAVSDTSVSLAIWLDNVNIKLSATSVQSSSVSTGTSGSCTNTVIARCQAGRNVGVRDETTSSGVTYLAEYTSFSGYKVPNQ